MSRTYRDSQRVKSKIICRAERHCCEPLAILNLAEAEFRSYGNFGFGYPHWWDRLHHIRPARAATGTKLRQVLRGSDDDGNWPNYRKPHIYYW